MWRERGGWRVACGQREDAATERVWAARMPRGAALPMTVLRRNGSLARCSSSSLGTLCASGAISAEMACKRRALGVALWLVPRTSNYISFKLSYFSNW